MVSDYRYSVHFEDGRHVTTNYVGDVLQVGDVSERDGLLVADLLDPRALYWIVMGPAERGPRTK
jgi:hypothetical protein